MSPGRSAALLVIAVPAGMGALLAWAVPRFAPELGRRPGARPRRLRDRRRAPEPEDPRPGPSSRTSSRSVREHPLGPEGPTVVLTSGFAVGAARLLRLPPRLLREAWSPSAPPRASPPSSTPRSPGSSSRSRRSSAPRSRGVLGSALLAAVAAAVVERTFLGGRRLLPAGAATWVDTRELIGFALVGLVCGLMAGALARIVPVLSKGFVGADPARGGRSARRCLPVRRRGGRRGAARHRLPRDPGRRLPAGLQLAPGRRLGLRRGIAWVAKTAGVALALAAPPRRRRLRPRPLPRRVARLVHRAPRPPGPPRRRDRPRRLGAGGDGRLLRGLPRGRRSPPSSSCSS